MKAKIENSFEHQAEAAKQNFQAHLSALLEVHADFLHRISTAKINKKSGIWIELTEAEITSGFILESVGNLMGSYEIINTTNKLLNANYQAAQAVAQITINKSIEDFKSDRITKEQFSARLTDFVGIGKKATA